MNKYNQRVTVLVDNESWILPYAARLVAMLTSEEIEARLERNAQEIQEGEICFLLGCTKIVPEEVLEKNKYTLVVHESDLPKGRGFAPMAWQILDGANEITFCLINASNKVASV